MELAVIALFSLACSAAMSILAFMIGRCSRKLPIDGMLPRVVHSARFSPEKNRPHPAPEPARPSWPDADGTSCQQLPHHASDPPPQDSKLCATIDATGTDTKSAPKADTCARYASPTPTHRDGRVVGAAG
jgi:hypothetical protein